MPVETIIEDSRWNALGLSELADAAVAAALVGAGLDPADWEVAILGCDDARIADLNRQFRGKEAATNVLSWPSRDLSPPGAGAPAIVPDPADPELGDIAISWDRVEAEARAGGIPLHDHALHLLVHGTLHLLGYDHVDDDDATVMETLEAEALASLGVPDPYSERHA